VSYWKPKSNATPFARALAIVSLTNCAFAPKRTLSVNWRAYVRPRTLKVGDRMSPVPSGASSVVTRTSPTLSTFAENPMLPKFPALVTSAK